MIELKRNTRKNQVLGFAFDISGTLMSVNANIVFFFDIAGTSLWCITVHTVKPIVCFGVPCPNYNTFPAHPLN